MIAIDRIVCPVDFSEVSRSAFDHAVTLARRSGARISAVHVTPTATVPVDGDAAAASPGPAPGIPAAVPTPPIPPPSDAMEWLIEPARRSGVRVEPVIAHGNTVSRILEHSDEEPADLVVMGTHGTGGFERFVMGSVAERIVRKASCPVLTVSPEVLDTPPPSPVGFDRILCAVDFSEASVRGLEYALTLADGSTSELIVLHVLEPPGYSLLASDEIDPATNPALVREARSRLEALLPANVRDLCTPRVEVGIGKAHEQILTLAQQWEAQVIVTGVHGRAQGVVERLFLGSVANHVVREAPCPVLSVRDMTPAPSRSSSPR